ncbi:alpha/beta hydrolase [Virgibacillus sp. LDC-1]|uniref:alpha/beta hydrolase n=1 Tax=Virgibacillus sp. LDC-1 TaxID=3039856 RepID=UPI0024DEC7A6|nr:alpha/beta hydrolase [Virgibacillus sp. LDC-1]
MKRKRIFKIIVGLLILLFIINVVASLFFYNLAIKRGPKDFLSDNKDLEVSAQAMETFLAGDWRDWVREQPFKEMELTSYDGLKLEGYFLKAKQPTNKLVIFTHGYLGNAKQMGLYGQYYYEQLGYDIFMADARGHGQSEGDYYGFGWHDRLDLIDWTNKLVDQFGKDTEIVWHGLSMGAATVLMASGEDTPSNLKAIIADSPYSSVHDLFAYQMKRMFHLPAFPFLNSTSVVAKLLAGYSLEEASALKQVKQANVPILYIHGNADTFVPTSMTEKLYQQTKSPATLLKVDGANHGEAFVIAKEDYINALQRFLETYVDR